MSTMLQLLATLLFINLLGCTIVTKDRSTTTDTPQQTALKSSTTHKQCTLINWYEVALENSSKGKDVKQTRYYNNCLQMKTVNLEQLDAGIQVGTRTYCVPETAFNHGSRGQVYNASFCEQNMQPNLEEQYAKGIVTFCDPAKMYKMALDGFVYENQCPESSERNFLNEYSRGRQEFIKKEISRNKSQISQLQQTIQNKRLLIERLQAQLNNLPKITETTSPSEEPRAIASDPEQQELELKHKILADQIRLASEEVVNVEKNYKKLVEVTEALKQEL